MNVQPFVEDLPETIFILCVVGLAAFGIKIIWNYKREGNGRCIWSLVSVCIAFGFMFCVMQTENAILAVSNQRFESLDDLDRQMAKSLAQALIGSRSVLEESYENLKMYITKYDMTYADLGVTNEEMDYLQRHMEFMSSGEEIGKLKLRNLYKYPESYRKEYKEDEGSHSGFFWIGGNFCRYSHSDYSSTAGLSAMDKGE